MLNRTKFFTELRHQFGSLQQHQVDGFNTILDEIERIYLPLFSDKRLTAYVLATAWHETATRMQPVIETRRADEDQNPSVETAIARLENSWKAGHMPWVKTPYWRKDRDGKSWLGRGFPQCTFKTNYEKCGKLINPHVDFVANPDLMLTPDPAAKAMLAMMTTGGYTGHKLSDYFNDKSNDPYNARRVINGVESAAKVEGYYHKMLAALQAA